MCPPRRGEPVIVHDLSAEAVSRMDRVDLATLNEEPESPIGQIQFHECIVGVGSFSGRPPWELHTEGDELLYILAGESELTVLEEGGPVCRTLRTGDLTNVPQGMLAQQQRGRRCRDAVHDAESG
jgi:uncharacterized cupin superfamily protein